MPNLNTPNYKICAVSENDVWYLSPKGNIHHWTGSAWTPVTGSAVDIAVGGGDVYVVNAEGRLYKWDNGNWTPDTVASNVKCLSVTSDGTCWVVNKDGQVLHKAKNGHWDANEVNTTRGAGPSAHPTPPTQKSHTVSQKETLNTIATLHHTTVTKLVELNASRYPSLRTNHDHIEIGWVLAYT